MRQDGNKKEKLHEKEREKEKRKVTREKKKRGNSCAGVEGRERSQRWKGTTYQNDYLSAAFYAN